MFSGCTWLHAPPYRCAISSWPLYRLRCCKVPMVNSVRIAIVGDVHDDWSLEEDTKALQLLKPDLVMFTGDFGNENVDLVESISKLDFSKAIILGNHDAWNTQKFSASFIQDLTYIYHVFVLLDFHLPSVLFPRSKEKDPTPFLPPFEYNVLSDAVQLQLEFLGDEHVGYGRIDFPNLKLSIVGGRPFSCGGEHLFRKKLLTARYGVHDMDESAKKIYEAALGTPADHSIIFLAHNGPSGLGSNVDDICGRDWIPGAGDHGDPDLAHAISQLKEDTKLQIKLVVFGHMHKNLAYGQGLRKMIAIADDNTIYVNGAVVPRVKTMGKEQVNYATSSNPEKTSAMTSDLGGTKRAFTIADIFDGNLEKVAETWVSVTGEQVKIEDELIIFSKAAESSKHSSCSVL
ncbi:uncharacterized protein LOC105162335 [Sesamum indicum]|uniref:Uncharacterized protein LOC105162335 n=1 Tax=Sesamum indicum TaxID=4182 RepID=A0A6I9TDE2_SESIN|nr:uncharacterized protein LOC105162335 [Sesamum indicum]